MGPELKHNPDAEFTIATFESTTDRHPQRVTTTWAGLQKALTRHLTLVDKKDAKLWSPARYADDATRGNDGVVEVSVLAFDIDDGTTVEMLGYWLKDLEHIITSSFSHTPEHPKLRVVIRLVEVIPTDLYDDVWRRANHHLLHGHVDPSTKDPARMLFVPSSPPGAEHVALLHDGLALDWRALPPLPSTRASWRKVRVEGVASDASDDHKRAHGLLGKFARDLAATPDGERHFVLLQKARAAGGLKASGLLAQFDIETALFDASVANGEVARYGEADVWRAIRDGISYGEQAAWVPDDLPESPTWTSSFSVRRNGAVASGVEPPADDDAEVAVSAAPEFPISVLPREGQLVAKESSLPTALLAGSMLAALMAACGDAVEVQYSTSQVERPIGLIVPMAPKSAGKSPAQRIALRPLVDCNRDERAQYQTLLQEWQAQPAKTRGDRPANTTFIRKRITPEGLLRDQAKQPAILACPDELAACLRDLAGYRLEDSQSSSGLDLLLEEWTGEPMVYTRVGKSPGEHNAIDLYIERPTLVLVGGLQTIRQSVLGPIDDGIRPRWLVHLADRPEPGPRRDPGLGALSAYEQLIRRIYARRGIRRRWHFSADGQALFDHQVLLWKQRAASNDDVNDSVAAALDKADAQVLKLLGALAEAALPALPPVGARMTMTVNGAEVVLLEMSEQVVRDALEWMNFVLDCWACLQGGTPLARSQKERALIDAATRVMDYVDLRGREVLIGVLKNNSVGGIQTREQAEEVVDMVGAMFPGTVKTVPSGPQGGRPSRSVSPRKRVAPGTRKNPPPP